MERLIPRWAHSSLGTLIINYFVFVRNTEVLFAERLWGEDACEVLHYEVFYRRKGLSYTTTDQFTRILESKSVTWLGSPFGIQDWRHLAAAIGRALMVGIIDPFDDMTTGMDGQGGRESYTSEMIYAIEPGQVGRINDRTMALFLAVSRLWWTKVLHLKVKGKVAPLKQILDPHSQIDPTGAAAVDVTSAETVAREFEEVKAELKDVKEELSTIKHLLELLLKRDAGQVQDSGKGKGKAVVQVSVSEQQGGTHSTD